METLARLATRRPVGEPERIRAMVENANLTVCARDDNNSLVAKHLQSLCLPITLRELTSAWG